MNTEQNDKDCFSCRLVSSGGLYIAGYYVYRQSLNKTRFNQFGMLLISTAFALTGTARLFNLFPIKKQQMRVNKMNDES